MKKILLSLATIFFASISHAGDGRVGNGGGAWVCRNADLSIRWIELVDLYEAQHEFQLKLPKTNGKYEEIVDRVKKRANLFDPDFLLQDIDHLKYLKEDPQHISYSDHPLNVIDDALYMRTPDPHSCKRGVLDYEQVVDFESDGTIIVQRELFNALSERTKAALVIHEGLYQFEREDGQEKNSVHTRRLVGLIFSDLSYDEIRDILSHGSSPDAALNTLAPGEYDVQLQKVVAGRKLVPISGQKISISGAYIDSLRSPIAETSDTIQKRTDGSGATTFQLLKEPGMNQFLQATISATIDGVIYAQDLPAVGFSLPMHAGASENPPYDCEVYLLSAASLLPGQINITCSSN